VTTIVAVQHDWGVEIGSDLQTTNGDNRAYNGARMVKQISRDGYIIACGGTAAPCDVAMYLWQPPVVPKVTKKHRPDMYQFAITEVVPSLRLALAEIGYKMDESDKATFSCLLVANGEVFLIESDGTVMHHQSGIYGIGSGGSYAVGALYAGASMMQALETAALNDAFTSGPFVIDTQAKP